MENIQLPEEAILVKEIKKQESVLSSGLILTAQTNKDTYHEVILVGSKVNNIKKGDILRVKKSYGEELSIDFVDYLFFSHADSCYYYKK